MARNENGNSPEAQSETRAEPAADAGRWAGIRYRLSQSFRNFREQLSDHLRIRRHDQPVRALMSPSEHFYLRQNLRLMLEQAQAALLQEQSDIYQTNLRRASQWLEEYFVLNPQTQAVREQLLDLAQTPVTQSLPDLSSALALLQEHVARLHRLSPSENNRPTDSANGETTP